MSDNQHAHELLDRLGPGQLAAVVHLLETMVEPVLEDEEISAEEEQAVNRSKEWFKSHRGASLEEVAAEMELTVEQIRHPKGSA